jgi:hypothetical protein
LRSSFHHFEVAMAGARRSSSPHFGERPPRLDARVDVHAARAARLGKTAKAELFEKRLHLERHGTDIGPRDAWPRIEIDAKLVRVIEVGRPHRVRVELDAAEVHDPREARGVVDHDFFRRSTGRKRKGDGS